MLGIDIGNNEIKITARKGDTIRMVSEKLPTNLVKDGVVQLQDAMAEFIKNIRKKYKLPGGDCSLILPPSQVFCRHIHFPVMEEERLRINLPYEMRDYLSGESDRYFYDYLVDDVPKDESGAPMGIETTAAAVLKTTVVENSLMLQSAGLKLVTAIPQEMAYRNLLMQNPEIAEGKNDYCIVDIGHLSTHAYFYKGTQHEATKLIDVGCTAIDMAIAEAMDVDVYVASAYKETNHNSALDQPQCEEVYNHIAFEIMKALNFYGFTSNAENAQHIYYAGGGSEIQPLLRVITETTGLTARSVNDLLPEKFQNPYATRCALSLGATLQ